MLRKRFKLKKKNVVITTIMIIEKRFVKGIFTIKHA